MNPSADPDGGITTAVRRRSGRGITVVRLANYIAPRSGGIRTALRELGAGYLRAGHEPVLIIPGPVHRDEHTEQGRVITIPGPLVPGTGGYRVITARRALRRLLEELEPDRLEVSDRTTLRWTGTWARENGVRSAMISHDSLHGLLDLLGPPGLPVRRLADRLNHATAATHDVVVCTTEWAAAEFRRLSVPNLVRVPLGVDLTSFAPGPVETFGLAGLEALASGTPVVVNRNSALPEVIGPAGLAAEDDPPAYADAIEGLLARDRDERRRVAREQAERFDWRTSVDGFLRAHAMPQATGPGERPR